MKCLRFASLLLILAVCVSAADAPAKKRVAVLDFDDSAAGSGVTPIFFQSNSPNIGKAITDLLISRLVESGAVSVIERSALDKLLAEQDFSNSDRTDPLTAARLGRVLGVDAIVLGTVTQYNYEDKTTGGGGGFGPFGGGSMKTKHDITARVQITTRVVSPDTAEVLSVAQGKGEIVRKGVKVDMRDTNAAMTMMTGNVNNPIMTEALDKALAELAPQLELSLAKVPPRRPVVEGLVASVSEEGRLVLNVGSQHGVKNGQRLQVWRPGPEIRDPATGRVLLRDDRLLGEAVVTSVADNYSIATYEGSETVKLADAVKSPPP